MTTMAILLIDHGSRREQANEMLESIAELVRHLVPNVIVEIAHMELAQPDISAGIRTCVSKGASEIVAVPYMLSAGRHATEDIPRLVQEAAEEHNVHARVCGPLGVHQKLAELVVERAGLGPT